MIQKQIDLLFQIIRFCISRYFCQLYFPLFSHSSRNADHTRNFPIVNCLQKSPLRIAYLCDFMQSRKIICKPFCQHSSILIHNCNLQTASLKFFFFLFLCFPLYDQHCQKKQCCVNKNKSPVPLDDQKISSKYCHSVSSSLQYIRQQETSSPFQTA